MKDISLYETIPPEKNDFTLRFRHFTSRTSLIPHWHEHIELLFFLKGRCEFVTGGKTLRAEAGDLVVVNGSEVHSYTANTLTDYYCLIIYPAFFSDVEAKGLCFCNLIKGDEYIKEAFFEINAAHSSGDVGSDMMQKSHAYRLMAHLMKHYRKEELTPEARYAHDRHLALLDRVKAYIATNHRRHISTEELAGICFFSIEYFCRFFKKMTGRTALAYVNEYRIEKATVLLTKTDEPIGEIAESVGFDDLNYFSRVFKKVKKCSPGEYRKIHTQGEKNERNT
jgi:AraC-like DNA-binding protein/quercetin dioxygenase-like cupin family protein